VLTLGKLRTAARGEIIAFGAYAHTAGATDRTPIQWRVLSNSFPELFLLSEYILDCKRFHGELVDITWAGCDLRKWLNGEFYHAAFSSDEMRLIVTSPCTDNGQDSPDTDDKVFLLSVLEVQGLTGKRCQDPQCVRRLAVATEFSKQKKSDGCHLYVYDKSVSDNYIVDSGGERGCSWWWLRTRGNRPSRTCFVGTRESIRSYASVDLARDGVRPALRIRLG
jgi:hypothetical protein